MVELPPYLGHDILSALDQHRTQDAKRLAADLLRLAASNPTALSKIMPEALEAIAEMIRPSQKYGRGRRKKEVPSFWYEIGTDYDELCREGKNRGDGFAELAKRYGCGEDLIDEAVRYYNRVVATQAAAIAESTPK
jgi:hypothetical protein